MPKDEQLDTEVLLRNREQRRQIHTRYPAPLTLHIDRRAVDLVASSTGDDDDLLATDELAEWLKVSSI